MSTSSRDKFSPDTTIRTLQERAGNHCSNPQCKKLTSGPNVVRTKASRIGVAAHITAASLGGPRHDSTMSVEERKSIENGIWLCQNCARLIDVNYTKYSVALLKKWRDEAEKWAESQLEGEQGSGINLRGKSVTISKDSEVGKIILRLNQVLDLMNEERRIPKFSIISLAEVLQFDSPGELESIFRGHQELDFKFLDRFCDCFGVDKNWLKNGKNHPFKSSASTHLMPTDYLEEIRQSKPECVYFVRSKSPVGESIIVLKYSEWCFKTLPKFWHVSDEVGGTGIQQLVSLYKLIVELKEDRQNCGGKSLEEVDFWRLNSGEVFAGSLIDSTLSENPWWDDFTDIQHKFPISERYELLYGSGFVNAQKIVKRELEGSTAA
jgi:hypothetical protein